MRKEQNLSSDMKSCEYETKAGKYIAAIKKRNRRRKIRKRIIISVFSILLIALICAMAVKFSSSAHNKTNETVYVKQYTNVLIYSSDTLTGIADEYADEAHYNDRDEYIEEVLFMNHMNSEDDIEIGDYIIIPYFKCVPLCNV